HAKQAAGRVNRALDDDVGATIDGTKFTNLRGGFKGFIFLGRPRVAKSSIVRFVHEIEQARGEFFAEEGLENRWQTQAEQAVDLEWRVARGKQLHVFALPCILHHAAVGGLAEEWRGFHSFV